MPELPEVETVRLGLASTVLDRTITAVEVTGRRSVRRQPPAELVAGLTGSRIVSARRRGKYLLVDLDSGEVLVVHLRMSGQLLLVDSGDPIVVHTHIRIALDDGRELRFVDPRTFGEMFVTDELDGARTPVVLASLGIDPLVDGIAPGDLAFLLARHDTMLKAFLLDQSRVCGIGNIYADEICHVAKVSPLRRTRELRPAAVKRLTLAISGVLEQAVVLGGSSLRDARYRDLAGARGSYQQHHAVYDRTGLACPRCGGTVKRAKVAGRSTHYCPRCQR